MKKFKLRLNKETVENLNVSELKNIKAGTGGDVEYAGSRLLCTSNYEGSCRKSKSCTAPICIPL